VSLRSDTEVKRRTNRVDADKPEEDAIATAVAVRGVEAAAHGPLDEQCRWCAKNPQAHRCPACIARMRRAYGLVVEQDRGLEQAAKRMRTGAREVERLVEDEIDRREVDALKLDYIPNSRIRVLLERHTEAVEPELTLAELSRRAGLGGSSHVARMLGYMKTSGTRKSGKRYPGRVHDTISVENAGRIVRALGYAPVEIEGL